MAQTPQSSTATVSIMPFDGARKRRRAMIAAVTLSLLFIVAIATVTVLSRAMN